MAAELINFPVSMWHEEQHDNIICLIKQYTFLSFDDGIRQKICSRMLYGIAWVHVAGCI